MLRNADIVHDNGDGRGEGDVIQNEEGGLECGATFAWGAWDEPYYDYEDGEDA